VVFSSFNHALADTLTPGESAHQIGQGLLSNDVERIAEAVANPGSWKLESSRLYALIETFSEEALLQRWNITLAELDNFFVHTASTSEALFLRSRPTWWLRMRRFIRALVRRRPLR